MYLESWFIDSNSSNCDNILNEKTLCLVMPLFEYDLYEILTNFAPLDISFIKCILYQVLSGLTYLHDEKCIIHRDLTPVNILVNLTNKHCVIADFGRAKDISFLFENATNNEENNDIANENKNNCSNSNTNIEEAAGNESSNLEESKSVSVNESDKNSNKQEDNSENENNDENGDVDDSEEEEDIDIYVNNKHNDNNNNNNGDGNKTIESNENKHENQIENENESKHENEDENKTEYHKSGYKIDSSKFTGQMYPTRYRAPELLLGSREYDFAIDIWALGCIFGQMCFAKGEAIVGCDTDFGQLFGLFEKLGGPQGLEGVGLFDEFCFDTKPLTKIDQLVPYLADDENACDLLSKMLAYNPKQRITAPDAWTHSFLDDQWLQDGTFDNVVIPVDDQNNASPQDNRNDDQTGLAPSVQAAKPSRLVFKYAQENEVDDDDDDEELDY